MINLIMCNAVGAALQNQHAHGRRVNLAEVMQMIISDDSSVSLIERFTAHGSLANANAAGANVRYFIACDADVVTTAAQFDGVATHVAQSAILDCTVNSGLGEQITSNSDCRLRVGVSRRLQGPIGKTEGEAAKDHIVNEFL